LVDEVGERGSVDYQLVEKRGREVVLYYKGKLIQKYFALYQCYRLSKIRILHCTYFIITYK
jgi:hypothetical protein